MAIELNTALYSMNGVDTNNVAKVSAEILAKSNSNPEVKALDYSKFNRANLGIDLYSSRTNSDMQKQVALTRAGLYMQSLNVAKLNSQAAMNLYGAQTVQKNVELHQSIESAQGNDLVGPKKLGEVKNTISLFNISDKNANSSNGFNPFETKSKESSNEENN